MSQQWSLNYYKNSSVGSRNKTQISCYLSSRSVLLHITFSCFIISVYAFNIDCSITVICILHPFYSYFFIFFFLFWSEFIRASKLSLFSFLPFFKWVLTCVNHVPQLWGTFENATVLFVEKWQTLLSWRFLVSFC